MVTLVLDVASDRVVVAMQESPQRRSARLLN